MVVKYRKSILHLLYFPPNTPVIITSLEIAKPKPVPPCARARLYPHDKTLEDFRDLFRDAQTLVRDTKDDIIMCFN